MRHARSTYRNTLGRTVVRLGGHKGGAMLVKAKNRISESDFNDVTDYTHAKRGDVGQVVGINEALLTVTWERSGTTCDCCPSELEFIS